MNAAPPHPGNGPAPSMFKSAQSGSAPPPSSSSDGAGHLPMQPRRVVVKPIAPKQQLAPTTNNITGAVGGAAQRPSGQQPLTTQAIPAHTQLPATILGTRAQPITAQQAQARIQPLTSQQTPARIQPLTSQQTQALLASQLQNLSHQQAQALLSVFSTKNYGSLEALAAKGYGGMEATSAKGYGGMEATSAKSYGGLEIASVKSYGGLEVLADECLSQQPALFPGGQMRSPAAPHRPVTPMSQVTAMDTSDTSFAEDIPSVPQSRSRQGVTTSKPRKPCNCRNSQCLKLYCDCFANGEFCGEGCHCCNCKNNVQHTEDRAKAVKTCLERNPNAFKPKVEQSRGNSGDERKHVKGCNCKRSGCLKNYCECYEAKIPCSNLCRCVGCKNLLEKPENKSLMQLADAADIRTQQQKAASSHIHEQLESTASKPITVTENGQRLPFSFINKDVAKATCLCLLEEASHALMNYKSPEEAERAVIEEFGKCIQQIIAAAGTASEVPDNSSAIL